MATTVVLGNYRFTLRPGFPQCTPDGQIWSYRVELEGETPPGEEISDWALELCPEHVVLESEPEGEVSDELQPCLHLVPMVERQIKWEGLNDEVIGEGKNFTFVLSQCYEPATVNIALKRGGAPVITEGCVVGLITGPSCEEENDIPPVPVPSRGIPL